MIAPDLVAAARFAAGLAVDPPGEELLPQLRWHGLAPLVAARLGDTSPTFARELRAAMAVEIARQRELASLLDEFAAAGVEPITFKGTALAYTVYQAPWLRARGDVDLLIRKEEKDRALAVLVARGYALPNATSGDEVMNQRIAVKTEGAVAHHVDVHWRLSNAPGFADRFAYDDLRESAAGIERLGPNARRPSELWSLLIACAHRVAHHREDDRLIWLYDIHLLATKLDAEEFAAFEHRAREEGMWSVVVDGLEAARAIFDTQIEALSPPDSTEWSAAYLARGRSRAWQLVMQLRQLPLSRSLRLVTEHAFPPGEYMLAKYGATSRCLLPWLYIRRLTAGISSLWRSNR